MVNFFTNFERFGGGDGKADLRWLKLRAMLKLNFRFFSASQINPDFSFIQPWLKTLATSLTHTSFSRLQHPRNYPLLFVPLPVKGSQFFTFSRALLFSHVSSISTPACEIRRWSRERKIKYFLTHDIVKIFRYQQKLSSAQKLFFGVSHKKVSNSA